MIPGAATFSPVKDCWHRVGALSSDRLIEGPHAASWPLGPQEVRHLPPAGDLRPRLVTASMLTSSRAGAGEHRGASWSEPALSPAYMAEMLPYLL